VSIIEAILLGIVQGLTEFLPVSSSGHIELVKALFGVDPGDDNLVFTIVVHFATAMSTVVVFRKDVAEIFRGLFAFKNNESLHFSLKIIVSMIPAVFVGLAFEDSIDALFSGQILLVGALLIITALLLLLADKAKNTDKPVSYMNALVVGVAQAIAILPGISRSGATISTSVLLGIDRSRAARFSFLMVVPLIFGKVAKDLIDGGGALVATGNAGIYIGGFAAAFVTGLLACKLMIALVRKAQLKVFAIYCFAVGLLAMLVTLWA
jgi:undecaprenyl-diphosphatase